MCMKIVTLCSWAYVYLFALGFIFFVLCFDNFFGEGDEKVFHSLLRFRLLYYL